MCGIAGFINTSASIREDGLHRIAKSMACALAHRGPDDEGVWTDADAGVALSHRRLSILDLSAEGHQPMCSASGRYVGVFNGEMYNFADLREELECAGYPFRGHSDTEVLLAAVEEWGVRDALTRANGMLALALWDRRDRVLYLARDRAGQKPLYFGWAGADFVFGSELKALERHPRFDKSIHRGALALYLRHSYVPAPYSIYKKAHKLPAGAFLAIPLGALAAARAYTDLEQYLTRYWSLESAIQTGLAHPFGASEGEIIDEMDVLLRDAVATRMVADVPLGAFLSGGVDSSIVVALMQAQSSRPVRTFTIGSHDAAYDEAPEAAVVARHLGTDHTELYVTPEDALGVIPDLPNLYDEPFSDTSQIPTYLVSRLAREHVTVALSGDGGDEFFGGYSRYLWGERIWKRIRNVPLPLRHAASQSLTVFPPHRWDRAFERLGPLLPRVARQRRPGAQLHKLAGLLDSRNPRSLYHKATSRWAEPEEAVIGGAEPPTPLTRSENDDLWNRLDPFAHRMMYLDAMTYLPDDVLVKVDRASMAVSLEARAPLLDHRLIEFAWRVPFSLKIRNGQGKWILRQLLYRHVPKELIERPKTGFVVPVGDWLRGPLRGWAEDLLGETRLRRGGYFNPAPIRQKWEEHLTGRRNWEDGLWSVLVFQQWLASKTST